MNRGWPVYTEPEWNIWDYLDTCLDEIRVAKNAKMKHPKPKYGNGSRKVEEVAIRRNVKRAFRKRRFKRPD
jgi:hypothetical protein